MTKIVVTDKKMLPDNLVGLVARIRYLSFCLGGWRGELVLKAADAIEALAVENARLSTSEPQCAVVKPLVWTKRHGEYEHWQAGGPFPNRSPFPDYIIGSNAAKTEWYWCNFGEWDNSPLPSEDAAKAAAQADYEARILGAITMRTEAEVRAEAWAAALEDIASRAEAASKIYYNAGNGQAGLALALKASGIRSLITEDASAALDRIKAEAEAKGMRKAADICIGETLIVAPEGIGQYAALDSYRAQIRSAILAAIPEVRK